MQKLRSGLDCTSRIGFATAAATLISTVALAQAPPTPVQYFVNVQPIDVCPSNPGVAAAVNQPTCAKYNEPGSPPNFVGFADPNSGADFTREILNQAGIDVNFQPIQPYFTNQNINSRFNTLSLTTGNTPGQLNSQDLMDLTNQPAINNNNPPTPNQNNVPLSSDPHTLNMAFVSFLNPVNVSGVYYGLSLIGENGSAIDTATFGTPVMNKTGTVIVKPVPDALAHEIVHSLGLDHPTDNTALDNGSAIDMPPSNLMSTVRLEPIVGIQGAVTNFQAKTADQLNAHQIQDIIDPLHAGMLTNPFLNPIPNIDTQINNEMSPADFSVSFQAEGRVGESLQALTLTAPAGFLFESGTFQPLNLGADTSGIIVTPNCTEEQQACQSLILALSGTPFVLGDQFDYTVDVCQSSASSCVPVPLADLVNDLTGGIYTYAFSDGYQTSSILQPLGDPILDANSWRPDLAIPTALDLNLFTPFFTGLPCVTAMTTCPEPDVHADRYDLLDFEPVPEPPSIAVLFAGLGLWLVFDSRRQRRGGKTPVYAG